MSGLTISILDSDLSEGVDGRERLLTVIEVIFRLEKGAGLRFAFRIGDGELGMALTNFRDLFFFDFI